MEGSLKFAWLGRCLEVGGNLNRQEDNQQEIFQKGFTGALVKNGLCFLFFFSFFFFLACVGQVGLDCTESCT